MSLALATRAPAAFERRDPGRFNAYLLTVDFETADGAVRSAVGGGESLSEAIAAARESLPDGHWSVARWNHLYGD